MNFKSNTSRRMIVPGALAALASLGLLFFPAGQNTKAAPPCPFVVDASSNPGFTHTTIQAAVNDLPDPGPCVVVVRAATYAEQVNINDKNRAATSESQRVSIVADPSALPGTVIVDPPGTTNTGFVVNHSKFITVKGFLITGAEKGITMAGGSNSSDDIKLEANHIHTIGSTGASGTVGIGVGSGNARTVVVNNLIRNVGRSGIDVDSPNSDPIYIVNNTIVSNMWNGVTRAVSANLFLINNLIVGNGISSGGSGNCRTGLCQTSNGTAATVTLVNNMFYNNVGGDLSTPAQQLDATDSGNRTTTGAEGTGVVGCTFADCLNTHVLDEVFVSSGSGNYHLRTSPPISPAIDTGVNSFVHDPDGVGPLPAQERVPPVDFDFHARPFDGDNNAVPVTDIGFDEALAPTAADGVLSGSVFATDGTPIVGAVIRLDGTQSRKTITDSDGNYRFDNVETTGFYTVKPARANYIFNPGERFFSQLGNHTQATFTGLATGAIVSPMDTAEYFVRQHYLDFLGREPDEAGFNFWSDQILECGSDSACIERRRINVSAAYFLSIEFQQTGGLVDSLYRASYGRAPRYAEFMPDTRSIGQNVIVGRSGWEQRLAANKQAFVDAWIQRPSFVGVYGGLADGAFVDTLISQTGVSYSQSERDALVSGLSGGTLSRGDALLRIAEDERFVSAKRNEVFVLTEYFGFLRRDPDESGYQFWLRKLNQFNGNFEQAEMVKAFMVSGEYRDRFAF